MKPATLSSKILDFVIPSGGGGRSRIRARVIVVFAMAVPFVAGVVGPAAPLRAPPLGQRWKFSSIFKSTRSMAGGLLPNHGGGARRPVGRTEAMGWVVPKPRNADEAASAMTVAKDGVIRFLRLVVVVDRH